MARTYLLPYNTVDTTYVEWSLDIAGAYPTNESTLNISKATTKKEVVEIEGVSEEVSKYQTINYSGGKTNALEFCQVMYSMPTLDQLGDAFEKELAALES